MTSRPSRLNLLVPPESVQGTTGRASVGRPVQVLRSLKRHKAWVGVIFIVAIAAGLPVVWQYGTPVYYAEAVIHVSPRFTRNLEDDKELEFQSNTQYRQFVQHQVRSINRYETVLLALNSSPAVALTWQRPEESLARATRRLQSSLIIRPVRDTYLITVGLETENPSGVADLINAIVEVYLQTSREEEFYDKDQRIESLVMERDKLLQEVPEKGRLRAEIAQRLGVTTFNANLLNPYDQLLISATQGLDRAARDRIAAEAALYAIDPEVNPDGLRNLRAAVADRLAQDPGLNSLKANQNLRRTLLLGQLNQLTEAHPGRTVLEREMQGLGDELERETRELTELLSDARLRQARTDLYEATAVERQLRDEVERQRKKAEAFAREYHHALEMGSEIDRSRKRLNLIEDRVDFLMLEASAPGFLRLVSPARDADLPLRGGRRKLALVLLAMATVFSLSAPVAFDYLDPRVQVPEDVEALIGIAPLAAITLQEDPAHSALAQDHSGVLANALYREWHRGSRILAFTSSQEAAGTTAIVDGVSRRLGEMGLSVLQLEANLLRPSSRGGESIHPDATFEVTARAASREGATVLRLAPLDESDRLRAVRWLESEIKGAVESFDVVVLDLAPLLDSPETELLLELASVALLVVPAGALDKNRIRHATRRIEATGVEVFGAVLNRVQVGA